MSISAALIGGASLLGGKGSILAAFLGVLALGMLNNGMNLLGINSFWQYVVKGVVILFAVYIDVLKKRAKDVKSVISKGPAEKSDKQKMTAMK